MSDMQITRKDVMWRAVNIWPPGHVQYNQRVYRNGWRTDCSGYVSMCLNLTSEKPFGGANTETLVTNGHIHDITKAELRPGDLIGFCGPGSAGDAGHVVLFDHWAPAHPGYYWAYEQHGGSPEPYGPEHSLIPYPFHENDQRFKPYRYRGIVNGGPGPGPGAHAEHGQWFWVKKWPDPLGTITGIAAHFGIGDWHKIWDDPENAGLRARRMVPENVQPGDGVWVPA